jgi:hypothetical protein
MPMNNFSTKTCHLIVLMLLLALAVIFFHSQTGKTSEESEQTHAQHDFSQLVSRTLQPAPMSLPQFDGEATLLAAAAIFSFQEKPDFQIDVFTPSYPKKPSFILLFSTLLI